MFEYVERGHEAVLVVVRGWAFDTRIFVSLDLPYNYLLYTGPTMSDFGSALLDWLITHRQRETVSLLGWSMGAYAVSDFAIRHAERVQTVFLVGARESYEEADVAHVEKMLQRNPMGFLRKFYKDCFAGHTPELYRCFKKQLQPAYLQQWSLSRLLADLDWIRTQHLDTQALGRAVSAVVVHGRQDRLAVVDHALGLVASIPHGRAALIDEAGHLPFLVENFADWLTHDG